MPGLRYLQKVRFQGRHLSYAAWKPFLNIVDASYWNVELKDESDVIL